MKKILIFILLISSSVLFARFENRLFMSAKFGRLKNVKKWIQKGANINYKNRIGRTPLMTASRFGRHPVVLFLLKKGVKVNEKDRYGFTALMFAVHNGYVNITKMLIKNGADIHMKDNKGRNALHYAGIAVSNKKNLKKILKKHGA